MYEREHCEAFQPNLNALTPVLTDEEIEGNRKEYCNKNKPTSLQRSRDTW